MVAMLVLGVVLLVAFAFVERRAAEPILPLSLFRNRTFATTSAIGFIVGLALFGSVTFLPLYLQVVKGQSPTLSGLQLTPMMAGLLVTSIVSGNLISRFGRYRPFPIIGTAVMTVALALLATLAVDTPIWRISVYMVVLGLGLGMVMQVLVLAVQNAVAYEQLGVATSGSTLFRQVGGSIGVALFGAVFANQLQSELAARLPEGATVPSAVSPSLIEHLPPVVHELYIEAFATALTPVFAVAAVAGGIAFALTWLLREIPLRKTARSDGLGESFASPRDDSSFRELERSLSSIARRENRWDAYEQFAVRAGLDLSPPELWLLARIDERQPVTVDELRSELRPDDALFTDSLASLSSRWLVVARNGGFHLTTAGSDLRERIHTARCNELNGSSPAENQASCRDPEDRRRTRRVARDRVSAAGIAELGSRSVESEFLELGDAAPALASDRDREALDVGRVVREQVDPILGDDDGVRVTEASDRGLVQPRLDREDHARLEDRGVSDVEERRLVVT
jgi:MFS family permease